MKLRNSILFWVLCASAAMAAQDAHEWKIPTAMRKLPNGLTIVVSEDHAAPTFGECMVYGIGVRIEPGDRDGFAHLFEHLMFEGTPQAPKGVFKDVILGGGGDFNGATRYDYTVYIASAPVDALDPILWLEADRMKALSFSQSALDNQRDVVKEEARSTMLNQPYGLFYAVELPQKAFDKHANNHNLIGGFSDLDSANLDDVKSFFNRYYAPNNAVLAIVGDVKPEEIFAKAEKYFGAIAKRPVPPKPDVSEPAQKEERSSSEEDALARLPALAIGYRLPPRSSRDAVVADVVADLLYDGKASRLHQALVEDKKVAVSVAGGANWPLGGPLDYNGPTLMNSFIVYPQQVSEADLLAAHDSILAELTTSGVPKTELERTITKTQARWYSELETPVNRATELAITTLFDGSPERVNRIPAEMQTVTSDDIKSFVARYLVKANRTVINRTPAHAAQGTSGAATKGGQ